MTANNQNMIQSIIDQMNFEINVMGYKPTVDGVWDIWVQSAFDTFPNLTVNKLNKFKPIAMKVLAQQLEQS